MLIRLKWLSWLFLIFGVIGFVAVHLGVRPEFGSLTGLQFMLLLQIIISGVILAGFKRYRLGKLGRSVLLSGGWSLVVFLVIAGQRWFDSGASGIS